MLTHISIHALHEESDDYAVSVNAVQRVISIHALHEESDGRVHVLSAGR